MKLFVAEKHHFSRTFLEFFTTLTTPPAINFLKSIFHKFSPQKSFCVLDDRKDTSLIEKAGVGSGLAAVILELHNLN